MEDQIVGLIELENAKMAILFYIPTSNAQRFSLLHISVKTCSCLSYLFVQEAPGAAD